MKTRRPLLFYVCVFYLFGGAAVAQPPSEPGGPPSETERWFGTLDVKVAKLRLTLEVSAESEPGSLSGVLVSLDQGNARIKLDSISMSDGQLKFAAKSIQGEFQGPLNDKRDEAVGTWTQFGRKTPLTLRRVAAVPEQKVIEIWHGTLHAGGRELVLQFRRVASADGEDTLFDSLSEGIRGMSARGQRADQQLEFRIPALQARFHGELDSSKTKAKGIWEQSGQSYPLELTKSEQEIQPPEVQRPQHPKPPYPYREIEVEFRNVRADIVLAGTLTLPRDPGKFPAVVLISGSGPQDRDETIVQHRPFLVIADYLTRKGVAVLRFDDRGVGKSTGVFAAADTLDFAQDVQAAVEFLGGHSEIDSDRIGLIGHSEGGIVAPIVAVDRAAKVAHIVLLAGPGVSGARILESQREAILRASGIQQQEIDRQQALMKTVTHAVIANQPDQELDALIAHAVESLSPAARTEDAGDQDATDVARDLLRLNLEQLKTRWFRFFLSHDPAPVLARVDCPVLALNGEKDLQVLPDLNLPVIEKALTEGGNPDYRCVKLAGLNHLFQKSTTGSPAEYGTIAETFSDSALELIAEWVLRH
jgi:hypothetical protein